MLSCKESIIIGANTNYPITVKRLGFGTMRLTGTGIYGEPPNRKEALEILRQTVENDVQLIDTADYYGEDVTNRLIAEALYPYKKELIICTKVGATRTPDKSWVPFNSAANIRTSIENNLRTLKTDQLPIVHFRVLKGSNTAFTTSMEAMFLLQQEGKILHVGVSNVTRQQLQTAIKMGPVATVENMFGYGQRTSLISIHGDNKGGEEVLDICEQNQLPLIPYYSLLNSLYKNDQKLTTIATKYAATVAQINIAWLLHRSPWILPIPGTSSLLHFKENVQAAAIRLTNADMKVLG